MRSASFQALFRALPSPHMIVDRNYRFVDANPAYEAVVMKRREELLGRNLFDLFPGQGDNDVRLRASIDRVFQSGRADTLAYIPYAIPLPDELGGGFDQRYWTAVHTPLLDASGQVETVLQNTVDVTEITMRRAGEAQAETDSILSSEIALLQRAQEVEQAYEATRQESSHFRRLFQQAPAMIAVLSGPDHIFTFANDSFLRFFGGRSVVGLPLKAAIPEIDGQGLFEMLDDVYAHGNSFSGESIRLMLHRRPDAPTEEAFMDFSFQPVRDASGEQSGVFLQGTDRTDAARASRTQRVLIDELNHRVKNTLAAVQAIARQSFRNIRDPEAARYAFEARILALSKAHNLLSERHWEAASLHDLLRQELAGVDENQMRLEGGEVELSAKATVALAMVFHELTMNALRYGALGPRRGRLHIAWERPQSGLPLRVVWRERMSEPPDTGAAPGFGIRLIKRIVEGELGGRFELDFGSEGVICRVEIDDAEGSNAAGSDL